MKKIMSVIAAVIMLTATLTSCGSNSSSKDSSSAKASSSSKDNSSVAESSSIEESSTAETSSIKDNSSAEASDTDEDSTPTVIASGYIGDTSNGGKEEDVKWTLYRVDENDPTDRNCYLEIEGNKGTGNNLRMKDFTKDGEGRSPFYEYKDKIGRIRVWRGVTYIGKYAFSGLDNTFQAYLLDAAQIGEYAFEGCRNLSQVQLSEKISKIGDGAFRDCSGLRSVHSESDYVKTDESTEGKGFDVVPYSFPESLTDISEKAFEGCTNLTLQVKQGSKAEEYAKQNNIKYETVK